MKHKAFVKSLPDAVRTRLHQRQNRAGLVHLFYHVGLILIVGMLIAIRVPLWGLLLPIQGLLIVFLFAVEHEATHKTPFANAALNDWVGRGVGLVILLPFEWFRYFHLAHHRYTNIPGKDPELLSGAKPEYWRAYIWHVSGLPYWGAMLRQLATNATARRDVGGFVPKTARQRVTREARWMLVLYALALISLISNPVLFWIWAVPVIMGQPFLRLFLMAEHGRCAYVANMFENTRTTYTLRAVRFLAWNMPYHTEHHLMPMVPFHQLPYLHEITRPYLRVTQNGYVAFTRRYVATFDARPTRGTRS